jgi:hypothetical protein
MLTGLPDRKPQGGASHVCMDRNANLPEQNVSVKKAKHSYYLHLNSKHCEMFMSYYL